eukprot:TRINITY_DN4887_c0_g3_i2.p1 TRINITY_DN4887_c0_g3~~TRINITY_DN4887_c0_g3_i2.p1  ORF type:complete len:101 (+),score=10.61 TRINITY_DN4887_c0_g3_i2:584-886(+)
MLNARVLRYAFILVILFSSLTSHTSPPTTYNQSRQTIPSPSLRIKNPDSNITGCCYFLLLFFFFFFFSFLSFSSNSSRKPLLAGRGVWQKALSPGSFHHI